MEINSDERFKQIVTQLHHIAKAARKCPSLNYDLQSEAQHAYELTTELLDNIRWEEMDHIIYQLNINKP